MQSFRLFGQIIKNLLTTASQAYFIGYLIFAPAAWADVTVDTSQGGNTSVIDNPATPIRVDIDTPDGNGVSKNYYTEFDVPTRGVQLNNSDTNANLSSGAHASVILNQVTSSNVSDLQGMLEVLGTSANVIIANPNGITCQGCGFINVRDLTLVTGVDDGSLNFTLGDGSVAINDLNADDASSFDSLIVASRSIELLGQIYAGAGVRFLTGNDNYNYNTGVISSTTTTTNASTTFAIDAALLGGIGAGSIEFISSERGLGVSIGGTNLANAGDITIDAQGDVVIDGAYLAASNDISIAGDAVSVAGTQTQIIAGDNFQVAATDMMVNSTSFIDAGNDISLELTDELHLQGTLIASNQIGMVVGEIDVADTSLVVANNISVHASQMTHAGQMIATNKLQVVVTGDLHLTEVAGDTDAALAGDEIAEITAGTIHNSGWISGGATIQSGQLTINASQVINNGKISGSYRTDITIQGTLLNDDGVISSGLDGLFVDANTLINQSSADAVEEGKGIIYSEGDIWLGQQGGMTVFDNQSGFVLADDIHITADDIVNSGDIIASAGLDITAHNLTNTQLLQASDAATFTIINKLYNHNGSILAGADGLSIAASTLVLLGDDADVPALIESLGAIDINQDLASSSITTTNGLIKAAKAITINTSVLESNDSEIQTDDALSLTAQQASFTDSAVHVGKKQTLTVNGTLQNTRSYFSAGSDGIEIVADHLDIIGDANSVEHGFFSRGDIKLGNSSNRLSLGLQAGRIVSQKSIYAHLGNFSNDADSFISGRGLLNWQTEGDFVNLGKIIAGQGVTLTVDGTYDDQGSIVAQEGEATIIVNGEAISGSTSATPTDAVPVDGTGTEIDQSRNGITIVNITAPDGNGVSSNFFTDFNVMPIGLILNNSTERGVSDLAGAILANTNLVNGSADVILNQVVSDNITELMGYLEVFGPSAHVVIANSNGISCFGCGFINTRKLSLVAGSGDSDLRFDMADDAEISITDLGASGEIDDLTIAASGIKLFGNIYADDLALFAGDGEFYNDTITAVADTGAGIDLRFVNEVEANNIKLVDAFKQGVMRLGGKLEALDGDIIISSANDVQSEGFVTAQGSIQAQIGGSLTVVQGSEWLANGNMHLQVGDLDLAGKLMALNDLHVQADNNIVNTAGMLYGGKQVTLATSMLHNIGQWQAGIYNQGLVYAGESLTINSAEDTGAIINQGGLLHSQGDLTIYASDLQNIGNQTTLTQYAWRKYFRNWHPKSRRFWTYEFEQNNLYREGAIRSLGDMQIDATGTLTNYASLIESTGDMTLDVGTLNNISERLFRADESAYSDSFQACSFWGMSCHHVSLKFTSFWVPFSPRTYKFTNYRVKHTTTGYVAAKIRAGGDLNLQADIEINNNSGSGTASKANGTALGAEAIPEPSQVVELDLAMLNGLYKKSGGTKYLIESDDRLIDVDDLLGGDYFFDRARKQLGDDEWSKVHWENLDSLKHRKLLGDAGYEQDLIRQALISQDAEYLLDGETDLNVVYAQLAENAFDQAADLKLSIGIELTKEQLDALEQDIVWYVEKEVQGEMVLVPQVYLAKSNLAKIDKSSGSVLAGDAVTIKVTGDKTLPFTNSEQQQLADKQIEATDYLLDDLFADDDFADLLAAIEPEQPAASEVLITGSTLGPIASNRLQVESVSIERNNRAVSTLGPDSLSNQFKSSGSIASLPSSIGLDYATNHGPKKYTLGPVASNNVSIEKRKHNRAVSTLGPDSLRNQFKSSGSIASLPSSIGLDYATNHGPKKYTLGRPINTNITKQPKGGKQLQQTDNHNYATSINQSAISRPKLIGSQIISGTHQVGGLLPSVNIQLTGKDISGVSQPKASTLGPDSLSNQFKSSGSIASLPSSIGLDYATNHGPKKYTLGPVASNNVSIEKRKHNRAVSTLGPDSLRNQFKSSGSIASLPSSIGLDYATNHGPKKYTLGPVASNNVSIEKRKHNRAVSTLGPDSLRNQFKSSGSIASLPSSIGLDYATNHGPKKYTLGRPINTNITKQPKGGKQLQQTDNHNYATSINQSAISRPKLIGSQIISGTHQVGGLLPSVNIQLTGKDISGVSQPKASTLGPDSLSNQFKSSGSIASLPSSIGLDYATNHGPKKYTLGRPINTNITKQPKGGKQLQQTDNHNYATSINQSAISRPKLIGSQIISGTPLAGNALLNTKQQIVRKDTIKIKDVHKNTVANKAHTRANKQLASIALLPQASLLPKTQPMIAHQPAFSSSTATNIADWVKPTSTKKDTQLAALAVESQPVAFNQPANATPKPTSTTNLENQPISTVQNGTIANKAQLTTAHQKSMAEFVEQGQQKFKQQFLDRLTSMQNKLQQMALGTGSAPVGDREQQKKQAAKKAILSAQIKKMQRLIDANLLDVYAAKKTQHFEQTYIAQLNERGGFNNSGSVVAKSDLTIDAQGDLTNNGQISAGGNADLKANKIINESTSYDGAIDSGITKQAGITAGGNLTLAASTTIENIGADISTGGNLDPRCQRWHYHYHCNPHP